MRFKKGSKIEVWRGKEALQGSWWPAEILSGNGRTYCVKYNISQYDDRGSMERVPRKAIRPLPPLIGGSETWVPGTIIEVFDKSSWKIAKILKVVKAQYYFVVKLLGSLEEFTASLPHIRTRQSWLDDQWILIVVAQESCGYGKTKRKRLRGHFESFDKVKYQKLQPDIIQKPDKLSSTGLERGLQFCSSECKPKFGACQKIIELEKDGRCKRLDPGSPFRLLNELDAVASQEKMLGDSQCPAFFNRIYESFDLNMHGKQSNGDEKCVLRKTIEPDYASSAASCSSNDPISYQHAEEHSSDMASRIGGETSNGQSYGRNFPLYLKKEPAAEVHELELHAYRSTMEALFASGNMSWEQEAMMTNLRLALNISNDEHLLELKHLVSAEKKLSGIPLKGYTWRLVHLASKSLKKMLGVYHVLF